MKRLFALLVLVAFRAGPLLADTPLSPPADYSTTTGGVSVTASFASDTTRISADGIDWTIPRWLRFVYTSPDGSAVLALADSGNLIGSRDPDQIVLTLYRAATPEPLTAALSALMDPAAMPQTVSHYAWMDGLVWENDGWTLTLTDGGVIRIDPGTGVFTRQ
jgi:hypothetical protein